MTATTFLRVLAATLLATFAVACEPESLDDVSNDSKVLTGTRLTPSQVASELRAAGFAEDMLGKMLCTAKYESSFYDRALNRKGRTVKRGLFQISSRYAGALEGCPESGDDLYDASANTKCAHAIFESEGIDAWASYANHKTECDRMKAPPAPGSTPALGTETVPSLPEPDASDVNEEEGAAPPETPAPSTTTPAPSSSTPEPTPMPAPSTTPTPAPAPKPIVGGCFSNTLGDTMEPMACVESKFDLVWQQCKDGKWYRGGDDTNGRFGPCNGSFPLPE